MTDTLRIFDLPDRLAAKRAPGLIEEDERHLALLGERLRRSAIEVEEQRAATLRLPGGAGQAAMDRDLAVHRLSRQLRTLRRFGADVCLGRMVDAESGASVYIGRLGLRDAAGEPLLVDWRSPAAEPFFGATHGNPMGLSRRRRYRWTGGRITDYWDEVFTVEGLQDGAALDDQSAFIASLGSSRSSRMRDVLGTIQADQDAIIRAGSRGALVVDGGPGTGKTVVALHRTAYLLYAEPRVAQQHGGVLLVGPHAGYLAYVDDVLPSLGEEGVQSCLLRDLVPEGASAPKELDPAVAALKASTAMARIVQRAVEYHQQPPEEGILVETPWADIALRAADWEEAFDSAEPGVPHNEAREQVWEQLVAIVEDRLEGAASGEQLARVLRGGALRERFARAWPLLDPLGVVADLWSVPAYLRLCAPGLGEPERALLQRADARAWTSADLPILDAARHLIGDPEEQRRRRRRRAEAAAQKEQMDRVVDDLIAADDDGVGLVTMLRGEDAQRSLIDESGLSSADPDLLAGPFSHIVVDEAQELSDAEWQMLIRRCPSRSFTIVGDRAQARHGFTESWQDRLERVGLDRIALATLSINYRTPSEVMAEAEPAIRAALPDANVPTSVRHGEPVVHGPVSDLGTILGEWLAAHGDGVAAVIRAEQADPRALEAVASAAALDASGRVRMLTPELSKGLEFDLVIVVSPESFGDGIEGAVDRYVAMTRATGRLVVLRTF